jgi:hypothetical protein
MRLLMGKMHDQSALSKCGDADCRCSFICWEIIFEKIGSANGKNSFPYPNITSIGDCGNSSNNE